MSILLNPCCIGCKLGAVIPRIVNITLVRPVGDTLGPHYTVPPYPRFSATSEEFDCTGAPAGTCGPWLAGGDHLGVSVQQISDTVDDIMACGGAPVTTSDHNCYQASPTETLDMRVNKLFGAQFVMASKNWPGTVGFLSNDGATNPNPNIAPDQTKYRTISFIGIQYQALTYGEDSSHNPTVLTNTDNGSVSGTISIAQASGVMTANISTAQTVQGPGLGGSLFTKSDVSNGAGLWTDGKTYSSGLATDGDQIVGSNYLNRGQPSVPVGDFNFLEDYIDNYNASVNSAVPPGTPLPPLSSSPDSYNQSGSHTVPEGPSGTHTWAVSLSVSRTNDTLTWSASWDETIDGQPESDEGPFENLRNVSTFSGTIQLSDPYTATDVLADYNTALNKWDMSDMTLSGLRTDEQLALAPLVIYDETSPRTPMGSFIPATMNDYNAGLIADFNGVSPGGSGYATTWAQRPWLDTANYLWRYPNGSLNPPSGFTGGATLITPLWGGTIISHNMAGSDPHFWFGFIKAERDPDIDNPGQFEWFQNSNGGYPTAGLPAVSMRWQNFQTSQYDGAGYPNGPAPPGNFRQAWFRQTPGNILGGKYVQATQSWPAVNFARPCGIDKFSADQTTVCAIVSQGSGFYDVKITGGAASPGGVGGINVNDFIAVQADGIYKVTGITDNGNQPDGSNTSHQWTISVGAKLDDLPTGYNLGTVASNDLTEDPDSSSYLGKLRFPAAPAICGRAAVTTTQISGTVTLTAAIAQPYLRKDPATGTISMDLYDAGMTLILSGVNLTRVSDIEFTFTSGLITAPAWIVSHGVDWTKSNSTSQRTGVHLIWTFNLRAAATGFTDPPAWYAGVTNCTGLTASQFNYAAGSCTAVGVLPVGYGENFGKTQVIFEPSAPPQLDSVFGSIYMEEIHLTMPDPFWQANFKPDGGVFSPDALTWNMDDGSGEPDSSSTSEGGATVSIKFYPHYPLVEALCALPAGTSLPSGLSLQYDLSKNAIAPPFYPNGIPIGDDTGGYASIETDWGFALRACLSGNRFAAIYRLFTSC